jgi:hypothetical protein
MGSRLRALAVLLGPLVGATFDRERDVWLRTYVNAPRGRPVVLTLQSEGEDAMRADVQVWRSTPGPDGRCSENRTEHIVPDRERTTVSRSADHGVTWTPLFIDELRLTAE